MAGPRHSPSWGAWLGIEILALYRVYMGLGIVTIESCLPQDGACLPTSLLSSALGWLCFSVFGFAAKYPGLDDTVLHH